MDDMKTVLYIIYSVSSFYLICFLWNCLLNKLAKSAVFSRCLALFKIQFLRTPNFHYNSFGKLIFIGCVFYTFYFIFYQISKSEKDRFTSYEWLSVIVASSFFNVYKMVTGYSLTEINMSLNDETNIGALMAHQTYKAYYKIVLESLKDRMTAFEKERGIKLFCKKLLIIIPLSCNADGTLNDKDDDIKEYGELLSFENDQGGNINREYKNKVHVISSQDIYIVAEFSSPVSTLYRSDSDLNKEQKSYIRDCYIKTLKMLVQGSKNANPCIVIEYNDAADGHETLSQCILSALRRERESSIIV